MATDDHDQSAGDFLFAGRIVPLRREGNVVYARSLRRGEEDTGEAVQLQAGDRLVIPAGEFVVDSRDIDELHNPRGRGGYRPVANTVWTWYQVATERLGFFLFFFALARRVDAAHALWKLAVEALERARREDGIPGRRAQFDSLAAAEVAVVALGRCYLMVETLVERHCPELELPDSVATTLEAVTDLRNAFEHIDERAEGIVGGGRYDAEALTVFDQPDFIGSSVIRYKDHELNFETQVIAALIDCRELIMDAIDARAKQQAGNAESTS